MQIWAPGQRGRHRTDPPGLPVHFTIDTYPGETFKGKVSQVRLNAQNTQNVVTYTVVVATDNPPTPDYPNGKMLPYMTANMKFEVERHSDVLMVPNAALRWKPSAVADCSRRAPTRPRQSRAKAARSAIAARYGWRKADLPATKPPTQRTAKASAARLGQGRRFRSPLASSWSASPTGR